MNEEKQEYFPAAEMTGKVISAASFIRKVRLSNLPGGKSGGKDNQGMRTCIEKKRNL